MFVIFGCFDQDFGYLMAKAYEEGLLGAGKLMIFADATTDSYILNIDEHTAEWLDGVSLKPLISGFGRIVPVSCVAGYSSALVDLWKATDVALMNERLPASADA